MQIVIDISEDEYQTYINHAETILDDSIMIVHQDLLRAVINGEVLPEGHGRLIDADELEEVFTEKCVGDCGCCSPKRKTDGRGKFYDICYLINEAPTIIEADKAESEEEK